MTPLDAPSDQPAAFHATRNGQEIPVDELPLRKAVSSRQPIRNYEFDLMRADGSCRNMLGDAVPLFGDDGAPRGAVAAFVDIISSAVSIERCLLRL